MLFEIVKIVFPVFAIIGVGYLFARWMRVDLDSLTNIMFYLLIPCLVFAYLVRAEITWAEIGTVSGGAAVAMFGTGALGFILPRRMRSPGLFLSVMFMNAGYMGLPLVMLAFGGSAVSAAIIYIVAEGVVHFSLGIAIVSGERSLREISRLPIIYVTIIALAMNFARVPIPDFVYSPIRLLGDAVIPLMLFALGYQLYSVRLTSFPAALAASIMRNVGGFAIALAFCYLAGVGGIERKVIIILSATPSAVVNFVIARKYHADTDLVSSIVLLSTILSIGTVTLALFLIEKFF